MINKVDRFGNPINPGDVIAYYGTTIGLIVGVVVKFNPLSYKVKTKKSAMSHGKDYYKYYNIPFSSNSMILTAKGMETFNALDILDDLEKLRLEIE